jgi:tetratricopeptide (TPR) repeat protein
MRMTVTLARVSDDTPLWTETFDRTVQDVFKVQDEITSRTVETISHSLQLGGLRGQVPMPAPRTLEAYDLYLLGRHHWYQRNKAGMQRARELFEQAIALDPQYAPAHAGLSDTYALLATWRFAASDEMIPRALAAAQRALELDPASSEAHASVGFLKLNWEWDWLTAARSLRRAIVLNPSNETAHRWLSGFLGGIGRTDEALPIAERARLLDPLSVLPLMNLGIINYLGWRFEEAGRWFDAALTMQPGFERARTWRALAFSATDRHDEALAILRDVYAASSGPLTTFLLGTVAMRAGNVVEGRGLLEPLLGTTLPAWNQAIILGALGDEAGLFAALERALVEKSDWTYTLTRQPSFRPWHGDARFKRVVASLGLPGPDVPLV